jgi:hypothetical protein
MCHLIGHQIEKITYPFIVVPVLRLALPTTARAGDCSQRSVSVYIQDPRETNSRLQNRRMLINDGESFG